MQAADREITGGGDPDDLNAIRDFAVACLRREQDQDLKAFQVVFDEYFLESSLYDSGAVEETVETLQRAGHTYEEQDALWLRTTEFGDDKRRSSQHHHPRQSRTTGARRGYTRGLAGVCAASNGDRYARGRRGETLQARR